jgi:predicted P-loop ATPase
VNATNVGIVFTKDQTLLGIDIDHCLKEGTSIIDHEEKEKIVQLIIEADSYTEISPSRTGLHIYLALDASLKLVANRHANFEAYTSGRYFTYTGNSYKEEKSIRTVTTKEALALLSIIGYPWGKTELISATAENIQNDKKTGKGEEVFDAQGYVNKKQKLIKLGLDDENLLKKMFHSKGGDKIKALYLGDATPYKNDMSSADMAFLAHLAFWTRKNPEQMEKIWKESVLGKREKTLTRDDYRQRSIANAIKNCTEVYESEAMRTEIRMSQEAPELDLLFSVYKGEKIFTQNTENMCRIVRTHPEFKGRFRYDAFKNTFEIKKEKNNVEKFYDYDDSDTIDVQTRIQILFPCFGKIGKDMVYDAIIKVSKENEIDSAIDWIKSLTWDGEKRLDNWISKTYHTPEDIYHQAVASNWFKGLVKRIIDPGCKFDYVLVLEGEQGTRKSTSLSILGEPPSAGPSWHVETAMSTDSKDFFMQFQGKAIIEFSEGETLNRTEVKRMKAIITMQSDKFRPPYGKMSVDFPRRCVFAMTTNQSEYLKDETGNRRWLPVACEGNADIEWLSANRSQLFAEAYHRLTVLKEKVYEFPEEETKLAQKTRRVRDPNEDNIAHWYFNKLTEQDRDAGVIVFQAFRDVYCNGMTPSKGLDRSTEMAITTTFKDVLRLKKVRQMKDGVQANRWFLAPDSMQGADEIPDAEHVKQFKEF